MNSRKPGRKTVSTGALTKLDFASHGTAFLSCVIGSIVLDSVILMASASHHLASVGFRIHTLEQHSEQKRWGPDGLASVLAQLAIWAGCLVLAFYVAVVGAHGVFHANLFAPFAMAGFALPGLAALVTTVNLANRSISDGWSTSNFDALLSAAPTVLALAMAVEIDLVNAGRLDAIVGLAIMLLFCARALIHLRQVLD